MYEVVFYAMKNVFLVGRWEQKNHRLTPSHNFVSMHLISKKIECSNKPAARWAHSACVIKGHFVIFGGSIGHGTLTRDVHIFLWNGCWNTSIVFLFSYYLSWLLFWKTGMSWKQFEVEGPQPIRVFGHASAALGNKLLFLFTDW